MTWSHTVSASLPDALKGRTFRARSSGGVGGDLPLFFTLGRCRVSGSPDLSFDVGYGCGHQLLKTIRTTVNFRVDVWLEGIRRPTADPTQPDSKNFQVVLEGSSCVSGGLWLG
jgi:hypothetical protein